MNSKISLFIFIFIVLAGCGVKGPPVQYPDTIIDSYIQTYTGEKPDAKELDKTKKPEATPTPPN